MAEHEELRAALARLRPEERQALAVRWQENSDHWEATNPDLGRVWQAMTSLALDVDRFERARSAGLAGATSRDGTPYAPHTMRPASRGRA